MKRIVSFLFIFLISSQIFSQPKMYLVCEGGESGKVLSHANGKVSLENGYRGDGEAFIVHTHNNTEDKRISLECCGGESGKYLSHANGRITLQNGYRGDGELWIMYNNNGKQILKPCGGESGYYLSHANGTVQLIRRYGGDGELWKMSYPSNNVAQSSNTQQNNNKVKIETDCINCFNGTCRMCNGVGGKNMFGTFVTCSGCLGSGKCSMCGGSHKIVRYYDKNVSTSNSNAGYSGVRSSGSSHNNNSNNSSKSRSNGKIICSDCHGSTICKSCGGKKGRWDYSWGDGNKHWFDCAICNGSGRCKLCRGMGYWY